MSIPAQPSVVAETIVQAVSGSVAQPQDPLCDGRIRREDVVDAPRSFRPRLRRDVPDDGTSNSEKLIVAGDDVSRNGITYEKMALGDRIVMLLPPDTEMEPTFQKTHLDPVAQTLGI